MVLDLKRKVAIWIFSLSLFDPLACWSATYEQLDPAVPSPLLSFPNHRELASKLDYKEFENRPLPADLFLSSLGICIHLAQGIPLRSYIEPLKFIGVRNVRDDFGPNPDAYVELHKSTGVLLNLIVSGKGIPDIVDRYKKVASGGALLSIEGPNEPNNWPIQFEGRRGGGIGASADWLPVADLQRELYAAIKSDNVLKRYPVFQVSEVGAENLNYGLQFLTVPENSGVILAAGTKFADFANVHNYVSSKNGTYADNQAWNAADPVLNTAWDGLYGNYGNTWNKGFAGYNEALLKVLPKVTTETGWDSVADKGGEQTQGKMILNTYLSQFRRGWRHTFIYMLRDGEGGSSNQGVFRADSRPKPAAMYIHNLTSILKDTKAEASLDPLKYQIKASLDTTHSLLLRKSSGDYFLLVWGENLSKVDDVKVDFLGESRDVEIFDPTQGPESIRPAGRLKEFSTPVSDHPIIIKIR